MASAVSKVKLNNGREIPVLGLGLWKCSPGEGLRTVKDAIDIGYRHFDGALFYQNEKEVGAAIVEKIQDGTVKREDLFITSKLWNTFHNPRDVERACRRSLADLRLDYLDLYLMHFPYGFADGDDLVPMDSDGKVIFSDHDYVDTWRAMEELVKTSLVRSIGVSNFNREQLERILDMATIKPVTNQVECHPYLPQLALSSWMRQRGVVLTAYSSLGSGDMPAQLRGHQNSLLQDPRLLPLADKYNKTPAQILLRYILDRECIVIPKSVQRARLQQNMDVFGFQLTPEDIATLNGFSCNGRFLTMKGFGDTHKYYPFNAPF